VWPKESRHRCKAASSYSEVHNRQGYYFSPPLSPDGVATMLTEIGDNPLGPEAEVGWPAE